jgi:predicted  nucleic acid-binding Zn-ribbon protein
MMAARQLYSLQELDLALDLAEKKKSEAEQEAVAGLIVGEVKSTIDAERQRHKEYDRQHRLQKLEADGLRERASELDTRLYSGELANPRDLGSLELEVANIRNQLQQRDTELLELTAQAEESQKRQIVLKKELSDAKAIWKIRLAELQGRVKEASIELESLAEQRAQLVAMLIPQDLKQYESLRVTKNGRPVAKVERGLCQACRMSLPTQQLQGVRAGRQRILCSSCGRILFTN